MDVGSCSFWLTPILFEFNFSWFQFVFGRLGKREKRKYSEKNKLQNTKILIGRPPWVCINKLQISFKMRDCPTDVNDLNSDLLLIRNWCFNNFLLLNPDKTKLVSLETDNYLPNSPTSKYLF